MGDHSLTGGDYAENQVKAPEIDFRLKLGKIELSKISAFLRSHPPIPPLPMTELHQAFRASIAAIIVNAKGEFLLTQLVGARPDEWDFAK